MDVTLKGRTIDADHALTQIEANLKSQGDCSVWTGHVDKDGYGLITLGNITFRAHRIIAAIKHGTFSDSKMVLHNCDNPPCCNPSHLYIGTALDNARDKAARGRAAKNKNPQFGAKNGRAVLEAMTPSVVVQAFVDVGLRTPALSALLGVSHSTCVRYLRRHHLAQPPDAAHRTHGQWNLTEVAIAEFGRLREGK